MTRHPRTPLDRPDPLTLAIEASGARFAGHGLPFLRPPPAAWRGGRRRHGCCAARWRRAGRWKNGPWRTRLATAGRLKAPAGERRNHAPSLPESFDTVAGRQAQEREASAGAMAPVPKALHAAGARANAQRDAELHRRPRAVRTAAAVECRPVWVGR